MLRMPMISLQTLEPSRKLALTLRDSMAGRPSRVRLNPVQERSIALSPSGAWSAISACTWAISFSRWGAPPLATAAGTLAGARLSSQARIRSGLFGMPPTMRVRTWISTS
jgi:hypothetical protein